MWNISPRGSQRNLYKLPTYWNRIYVYFRGETHGNNYLPIKINTDSQKWNKNNNFYNNITENNKKKPEE